jgi:hypothetical protein
VRASALTTTTAGGEPVEIAPEPLGVVAFDTEAGETYELKKV